MQDDEYFVEVHKIVNHKILPLGKIYFKIVWNDLTYSWEPLENLVHCDKALEDYYNRLDIYGDSCFIKRLVDLTRKSKKLYHDDGEIY